MKKESLKQALNAYTIEKECIEVSTNRVYDYEFNSRLGIVEISEEYIKGLFVISN